MPFDMSTPTNEYEGKAQEVVPSRTPFFLKTMAGDIIPCEASIPLDEPHSFTMLLNCIVNEINTPHFKISAMDQDGEYTEDEGTILRTVQEGGTLSLLVTEQGHCAVDYCQMIPSGSRALDGVPMDMPCAYVGFRGYYSKTGEQSHPRLNNGDIYVDEEIVNIDFAIILPSERPTAEDYQAGRMTFYPVEDVPYSARMAGEKPWRVRTDQPVHHLSYFFEEWMGQNPPCLQKIPPTMLIEILHSWEEMVIGDYFLNAVYKKLERGE